MVPNRFFRLIHIIYITVGNKSEKIEIIYYRQMRDSEHFHPVKGNLPCIRCFQGRNIVRYVISSNHAFNFHVK